jgi:hypothetical protein
MFWEDIQMRSRRFVAETVYRVLALFAMTGVISATGCGIGTRNATVTSTLVVSDTHQNWSEPLF